jgi:hypothetical protein
VWDLDSGHRAGQPGQEDQIPLTWLVAPCNKSALLSSLKGLRVSGTCVARLTKTLTGPGSFLVTIYRCYILYLGHDASLSGRNSVSRRKPARHNSSSVGRALT